MKIKKQLIKREVAGETILVPVGKTVYDSRGLFVLNELGAYLWDRLPQAQDEEDLVQAVLEEYDVTHDQAAADIRVFLEKLRGMEIL